MIVRLLLKSAVELWGRRKSGGRRIGIGLAIGALTVATFAGVAAAHDDGGGAESIVWTRNSAPNTASIAGGPWTLEQSGAGIGLKSSGYCASSNGVFPGTQVGNPGTERMQPYYFPFVTGQGSNLQGYFDWRPKDTDEAVVAASSNDAGRTWTYQSKALELTTYCPSNPNKIIGVSGTNAVCQGPSKSAPLPCQNASNDYPVGTLNLPPVSTLTYGGVVDDGQGHAFVLTIKGQTLLYTLNRSVGHIDSDPLVIHVVTPTPSNPLAGAPAMDDGPTDAQPGLPEPSGPGIYATSGLMNPDGILGVVPDSNPVEIIYEQKILNGDLTDSTDFPNPATNLAICNNNPGWANYYNNVPAGINTGGIGPNDDITFLRLASTTDGINFTDLGPLQGLNDIKTVSANGTRWLATAGSILKLAHGGYGLLFSGGNCVDGDSDAFHYVGYAESTDLIHWNVINGLNNPIASVFPVTLSLDTDGVPVVSPATGTSTMIPADEPVVRDTQGFFAGRIYAPSATQVDERNVTVMFAGYHTTKPKNGLGDYRTIGRVSLHASDDISEIGANGPIQHYWH